MKTDSMFTVLVVIITSFSVALSGGNALSHTQHTRDLSASSSPTDIGSNKLLVRRVENKHISGLLLLKRNSIRAISDKSPPANKSAANGKSATANKSGTTAKELGRANSMTTSKSSGGNTTGRRQSTKPAACQKSKNGLSKRCFSDDDLHTVASLMLRQQKKTTEQSYSDWEKAVEGQGDLRKEIANHRTEILQHQYQSRSRHHGPGLFNTRPATSEEKQESLEQAAKIEQDIADKQQKLRASHRVTQELGMHNLQSKALGRDLLLAGVRFPGQGPRNQVGEAAQGEGGQSN